MHNHTILTTAVVGALAVVVAGIFYGGYFFKKSKTKNNKLKLYYFDIPGKGEAILLACAYSNIELDDVRIDQPQFATLREDGKLPFGQVPILEVMFWSSDVLNYMIYCNN